MIGVATTRRDQATGIQGAGFGIMLLAQFFLYSRVFDLALTYLHLTVIAYGIALLAAIFAGGVQRAFNQRIGLLMLGWHVWLVLCVPFSVWRGGSVVVLESAAFGLGVYVITAGLIVNYAQYRRTVLVLALSILTLAVLTVPFHAITAGRVCPEQGRFANPNDFAQVMLMVLPLWWWLARSATGSPVRRVFALMCITFLLIMMATTGSRGSMISLVITALVMFLSARGRSRVVLAAGALAFGLAAALLLPDALRERYVSFLRDNEPEIVEMSIESAREEMAATESVEKRRSLLIDSVITTFQHPIFGVGPGVFAVSMGAQAAEAGERYFAQTTHNTYTQVSSEAGIPALLLYLGILVYSFKATRVQIPASLRQDPRAAEISQAGFALRLCLIAFAVSAMFSSFGYAVFLPTLAGLAVAFQRTAAAELAYRVSLQPPPASPVVTEQNRLRTFASRGRAAR